MKHVVRWSSDNARELVFACGLGLLAFGLGKLSVAASCIVVGVILVWLAIPPTVKRGK